MITNFQEIFEVLKSGDKKRLVAAYANDSHTIGAVYEAVKLGIVEATLVGDKAEIEKTCAEHNFDITVFTIVQEADEFGAAKKAVQLINNGEGDMIMKGLVSTDKYMKAILNKETGLMPPKAVLSHVTLMKNPAYHKFLVVSDCAVIPQPDLNQKIALANYTVRVARALGIDKPKVAMIAASEQVLPKMQACVDASIISKMAERGQIKNAYVDGPLALDVAIDKEAAEIKKIESPVAGDADCLVFPNIESGNVFYKANTKLTEATLGAMVVGAKCPAILSSRGDSVETKLNSIALAALVASK
ncbi:MAG: bifunctional enoyl-CoA hydratase/phosphate acetyltransferase [Marinifilaceae bacterium]|jgi:phosphate butyryltransferase|nr:bifunctional enoyl-CoA hydratase/phosphate acetyltransferase [Marinifilaceae bacterium]